MSFIEFKDVIKKYTVGEQEIYAVNGVTFSIEQGEFCVIVGSSGAGKTTILNMPHSCPVLTVAQEQKRRYAENKREE